MTSQEIQHVEEIIKGKEWAENLYECLQQQMKGAFLNWVAVVTELTSDEEEIAKWANNFKGVIEDTLDSLTGDILNLQAKLLTKIEEGLKDLEILCKSLGLPMPPVGENKFALCQEYKRLQEETQKYKNIQEQIKKEISSLNEKYINLCVILGQSPRLSNTALLSPSKLNDLKSHIESLEQEKSKRQKECRELREKILGIASEMQYEPSTNFEKEVLCNGDLAVTDECMMQLRCFFARLEDDNFTVRENIISIWAKLNDIWQKLDVELIYQQTFQEANKGFSLPTLKNIRNELASCEELKKANIEKFIAELRKELAELWEKCHCDQEEAKNIFPIFDTQRYSEKVLERFEEEINKWRSFYDENKELLQLLNKHKRLWTEMLKLHTQSTGTDRLRNRGGQLLKDEKARNKLRKQIPAIEENIEILAGEFEKSHKEPFKTFGLTVNEYLQQLQEQWENVKKQRSSARKTPASAVSCTPLEQMPNVLNSNSATPKRKRLGFHTPMNKKSKQSPKTDSKKGIGKIALSTTGSSRRKSLEVKEVIEKKKRQKRLKPVEETPVWREKDYQDFENNLNRTPSIRSTMFNPATQ